MRAKSKSTLVNHAALGDNIRKKRSEKNISQEYLAEMLDISRQSISKWENGLSEPSRKNLIQLADIFDCELVELLGNEEGAKGKDVNDKTVVIGLSAGQADINRLKDFLREMPPDIFDCYRVDIVIAWGGDRKKINQLASRIERYTGHKVYFAESVLEELEPNRICLMALGEDEIDGFFEDISRQYGQDAIGVFLSQVRRKLPGIARLRKGGGLTICCEPEATQTGSVWNTSLLGEFEHVMEPLSMGYWIAGYVRKVFLESENGTADILDDKNYRRIVYALKKKSALPIGDFREAYVIMGLLESIRRRPSFPANNFYVDYLESQPEEQEYLFESIMRCTRKNLPEVTELLALKKVIPEIRLDKNEIRIWVTDCGNGLEAYTVGMLLADYLKESVRDSGIKIFATDMDEGTITKAIKGVYKEEEIKELPEKWRENYFQRSAGGWNISQSIRNMVIFSVHDIVTSPPFSRLDMIICRNAVNIFRIHSRRAIMKRFSYALKQDGLLMLGEGQEIKETFQWFTRIEGHDTLYRRQKGVHYLKPPLNENPEKERSANSRVIEEILSAGIPSCIVTDEAYEIIYVGQQGGRYLEFKAGEFSRNLFDILDKEIGIYVNMLVRKLEKEEGTENRESAVMKRKTGSIVLHVIRKFITESWYYLVWFEEKDEEEMRKRMTDDYERAELEKELRLSQESLLQALEELELLRNKYEVSNEKLQSANEELVVINDELQVSNGELAATNRKLARVNSELTAANKKLAEKNNNFQKEINKMMELSDNTGGGGGSIHCLEYSFLTPSKGSASGEGSSGFLR